MCYCRLFTGIRFMDMPVNVNISMMLTWLRAGRELSSMSFCHTRQSCLYPGEFIILCAGIYWTQVTQGRAGSIKIYPVPCSEEEFISVCRAEPTVWTDLWGVCECRHLLSFASTSSLPQGNPQDSPPPPPFVTWPRLNTPCSCKLGNYCEFEHKSETYQAGI